MKFFVNLGYGLSINLINALFPIVTIPYVLRILGPGYYGENIHAGLFYIFFSFVFISFISPYAIKSMAEVLVNNEVKNTEERFQQLFVTQIVLSIFAFVLHIISLCIFDKLNALYMVYAIATLLSFSNVDWLYYATQNYRILFRRTLLVRCFTVIGLYGFVHDKSDFSIYVVVMFLSYMLPNFITAYLGVKEFGFSLTTSNVRTDIYQCRHFFVNASVGSLYRYVDQILIGQFASTHDLAYVNILKQIINVICMVPTTISKSIMPNAISAFLGDGLKDHHKRYFPKLMFALISGCVAFIFVGERLLRLFTGAQFNFDQVDMLLVSGTLLFTSLAVYIDNQISIVLKLEKITSVSNCVVAVLSLLIMALTYNEFGYKAPILGLLLGEAAGVLVMLYLHLVVYKTKFISHRSIL